MSKRLKRKMYYFTMRNISTEQQGIQCTHVIEEYCDLFFNEPDYREYRKDKTIVVLDGGTSNTIGKSVYDDEEYFGTMEGILAQLKEIGVNHASFNEADLNNSTTAICFLADERVYNYEDYPDFKDYYLKIHNPHMHQDNKQRFLRTPKNKYSTLYKGAYDEWIKELGGEMNVKLRKLIKGKRLA